MLTPRGKKGLNNRDQNDDSYSEGRAEHLFFHDLFLQTVQVFPLSVHGVPQTVHDCLLVTHVSLYNLVRPLLSLCPLLTVKHQFQT